MVFHLPSVDKDGREGEKDTALIIFLVVPLEIKID
jgi:hypothetical protein